MWLSILLSLHTLVESVDNGLGQTPQMGWNTWNHFACDINEEIIKGAADQIVALGLDKLGYTYINIDDCWALKERDSNGKIVPDPERFPNGITGVAQYVHEKGLKLGIYSDAGTNTCQGQPGSLGHEETDVASFVEWGVDYLKYDNCYNTGAPAIDRYTPMAKALEKADRPIFFSICNWGFEDTTSWAPALGNSWRTSLDIKDNWLSMKFNLFVNSLHPEVAGPGGWNDPDMLEVGNGGMSDHEYKTHFTLWSFVKAPLIIGCDLSNMSDATKEILMNEDLIAINQDPLGKQAVCVQNCNLLNYLVGGSAQVWKTELSNGDVGLAIVNWDFLFKMSVDVDLKELGFEGSVKVKDLWDKTEVLVDSPKLDSGYIEPYGVKAFRLSRSGQQ